jgi:two-component system chemotaxis response regulator CheB
MAQIDAVVIGASAGGIEALSTIIRGLPADFCAAILIVLHTRAEGTSYLDRVLARGSRLPVSFARDDGPVEPGRIYVALPDLHLTVHNRVMQLVHGPKENGFRPAVDPLFRSAAGAFGSQVMGIILSGALDDGTHGLRVIKNAGGIAVVQDPDEAMHPQMVLSAMRVVSVDHVLRAAGIASLLVEHCKSDQGAKGKEEPG